VKSLSRHESPETLLFSEDGIWVRIVESGKTQIKAYIGLTDFAQQNIGPIEFVRILPKGRYVSRGNPFGSIESARKIVLIRAPVFGLIEEINNELREHPELIDTDPYGRGWIAAFRPFQLEEDKKKLVSKPEELERLPRTRLRE